MRSIKAVSHRLQVHIDGLANTVLQRETIHLEQLGVVREQALDLSYRARIRPDSYDSEEAGALRNIHTYYQNLPSGRMIVVGDPGAGKTVLAIHLLLDLLRDRDDPARMVPVVPVMLNASSWNIETPFSRWLATQLRVAYGMAPRVSRALVEGGHVLPFLDGLDEMDRAGGTPKRACAALSQLDEAPWRDLPVIAICRSAEFRRIRESQGAAPKAGMHAATLIELNLLTVGEARAYLERRRDAAGLDPRAWAPVIDALGTRPSRPLERVLAMPWTLNLVVYQLSEGGNGAARKITSSRSLRKLENLLFADLVPSAVKARSANEKGRVYTVEQTHYWLRGVALHLTADRAQGQYGTTIALHELWRIAGPKQRPSAKFITVPALLTMLILTMVRPALNFSGGLALGLACGVWTGASVARLLPGPRRLILRTGCGRIWRRRIGHGVVAGLSGFAAAGLLTGFVVRAMLGSANGLRAGLVVGAVAMFLYGPTVFLAGDRRHQPDEFRAIKDDWSAGLIIGLVAGASAGVTAWLASKLTAEITAGLSSSVSLGLPSALGIAVGGTVGAGLSLAWTSVRYFRACRLLWRAGFFDGHPSPFLDWTRRAGLLRAAGDSYQFRYEAFQHWLVAHPHPVDP